MAVKQITLMTDIGLRMRLMQMYTSMRVQNKYPPYSGDYVTEEMIEEERAASKAQEQALSDAIADGWQKYDATPLHDGACINFVLYKPDQSDLPVEPNRAFYKTVEGSDQAV